MTDVTTLLAGIKTRERVAADYPGNATIEQSQADVPRLVAAIEAVEKVLDEKYRLWAAVCGNTCGKDITGIDHDAIADEVGAAIRAAVVAALGEDK